MMYRVPEGEEPLLQAAIHAEAPLSHVERDVTQCRNLITDHGSWIERIGIVLAEREG